MIEIEISASETAMKRREQIKKAVHVGRQKIFFGQQLENVSKRLQKPCGPTRSGPVRD